MEHLSCLPIYLISSTTSSPSMDVPQTAPSSIFNSSFKFVLYD